MSEIKEIQKSENPLDELIEEINSSIFSKEEWIDNEFYKIPEMTYSYEKIGEENIVNKTLFSDLGGLNIEEFKNSDEEEKEKLINEVLGKVKNKILNKIEEIRSYLKKFNEIESGDDEALKAKKEIIEGGLKENIVFLNIALEGLEFEKEKAIIGLYFKGDVEKKKKSNFYIESNKRKEKLENIDKLNTIVFGEKISNNKEYVEGNLDYLYEKYENYKKLKNENKIEKSRILTEEEEQRYKSYIAKLQALSKDYEPKIRKKPEAVIDKKFKEVEVDIIDVKNNLNHNLIATDIQTGDFPHRAYFDKDISGFTDTAKGLGVPKNNKLKSKSAYDVIRLMGHENEQHGVSLISHEKLVGNIRGKQNLELVEGTAMLWEELFEYGENMYTDGVDIEGKSVKIIDLEKISYVQSFSKTIMEEILTDEEFYDFLELQNKIKPDKMSPFNRYLRFKRTGFQRKDITYTTGKLKAAKYINDIITGENDGDFSDLYLGKVGFEDLKKIKLIKENFNKKNETQGVKLPENLFFSEATLFGILQKQKGGKINKELFFEYIQKKYPFLNLSEEKINLIKFGFKKQLLGAINNITTSFEIHNKNDKLNKRKIKKERKKVRSKFEKILNRGEKLIKKPVLKNY